MDFKKLTSKEILLLFNELKKQPICMIYSLISFSLPILVGYMLLKTLKIRVQFIRSVEEKDELGGSKVIDQIIEVSPTDVKLKRLPNGRFFP